MFKKKKKKSVAKFYRKKYPERCKKNNLALQQDIFGKFEEN